ITRFIDGLDHHFGDEALMGWQRRYAELGFQMAFQRRFRGERALELFIAAGASSGSRPRPIGQRLLGWRPGLSLGARLVRVEIIMSDIEVGGGTEIFGGERLV